MIEEPFREIATFEAWHASAPVEASDDSRLQPLLALRITLGVPLASQRPNFGGCEHLAWLSMLISRGLSRRDARLHGAIIGELYRYVKSELSLALAPGARPLRVVERRRHQEPDGHRSVGVGPRGLGAKPPHGRAHKLPVIAHGLLTVASVRHPRIPVSY